MFELMIEQSLNPSLLIVAGFALLVGEVMIVGTFVLLWAALAAILVGLVSFFWPLSWQWQLIAITLLGSLFTWLLNPYLKKNRHTQEADAFAPQQTVALGQLHQNKDGSWSVFYKGTYWLMDPNFDLTDKQSGETVKVYGVRGTQILLMPEN